MIEHSSPSRIEVPLNAFTLVELLVVILVILALLAILLPALNHARESGRRAVCLSNLHQMSVAAQAYAGGENDFYPVAYYYVFGDSTTIYCWDLTVTYPPSGPAVVIAGVLWEGTGTTQIQQCPSFDGSADWADNPYTGYNYNTSYIGHGQGEAIPAPIKVSAVHNPPHVALFGDGQYVAGADKFMRAPWPNPGDVSFDGRWSGTQGFRHLNSTNVGFCDGHAESLHDIFTDNSDGAANVAEGTGFLSADNSLYDPG